MINGFFPHPDQILVWYCMKAKALQATLHVGYNVAQATKCYVISGDLLHRSASHQLSLDKDTHRNAMNTIMYALPKNKRKDEM